MPRAPAPVARPGWQPWLALAAACGVGAALLLTRVIESQLFDVPASDPLTFLSVALLLGGTALAANLIPAVRAMRVDPAVVLRDE